MSPHVHCNVKKKKTKIFTPFTNDIYVCTQFRCSSEIQRQKLLKVHMLISGSVSGFSQAILSCPIEVVKIRLQTLGYVGRSWNCMKHIFQHEGIYGLYRGLVPMIFRDILPYAIYTVVYDYMYEAGNGIAFVKTIRMQSQQQHLTANNAYAITFESFLTSVSALTASVLSWILITPLDVIKTIMQAETNPNIHKNMLESMAILVRAHKYKSLFSGSYMNVAKAYATLLGYQYCLNKCQANALKRNDQNFTNK
jgi:Mitochondrial carrier protein